jgi:hypothetical protein
MGALLESIFGGGGPRNPSELGPVPAAPPGFDFSTMMPPQGSSPGFGGGMFGGEGRSPMERWDPMQQRPFFPAELGPVPDAPPGYYEDPAPVPGGDIGGEDITVQGRLPFKPKKRSIWGVLGDAILLHSGQKPLFALRKQDQNVRRALENFTNDPIGAIQNLSQIRGMGEKALELHNQHLDNRRADETQARLMGKDKEGIRKSAMGILGRIKEDGSNYDVVRAYYNDFVTRNELDVDLLPDVFDIDYIESAFLSGMNGSSNVAKAEIAERKARQGDRRLDQNDKRIGITERDTNSKIADRNFDNKQDVVEEQGRDNRSKNSGKKSAPAGPGKEGETIISPSGTGAKTFRNGKWHYYEVVKGPDGKLKRGKYLGAK